jgi:hypothetical protein
MLIIITVMTAPTEDFANEAKANFLLGELETVVCLAAKFNIVKRKV